MHPTLRRAAFGALCSMSLGPALLHAQATSAAHAATATPAAAPFTYEDLLRLDRIAAMTVDPAGKYVAFQVRTLDSAATRGVQSLWIRDLAGGAEHRLAVSQGGAFSPQFAKDGALYFLSARGGSVQLYRTTPAGAEAAQVTKLALDIGSYRLAPDGSGAVVSLAVFPDCQTDEIACTMQRQAARDAQKTSGVIYDRIFVRHWDTWGDGTRNHLFWVPFAGGAPVSLTPGLDADVPSKPFGDESEYTFSPDGQWVYFDARVAGRTEPRSTNFDVFRVSIAKPVVENLTAANPAWDAGPRVSPDGKWLAYRAMKRPGFEADRFGVILRNLATGATSELTAGWDHSADDIQWAPDGKSIYLVAEDTGKVRLYQVDVATRRVTPRSRDGHIDAFEPLSTGGFVFLKSGLASPSQLYASRPGATLIDDGATNLTSINAQVLGHRAFGAYEQFSFKGWNDDQVFGYVLKPANYEPGKKYPVAFLIHGGPQGSFGESWSYRWNPESYAGAGYGVVMIDFHGSTGYGQAFEDAISQHWGDRPLEDLQKGWAAALAKYPFLDSTRACALGASYGGYMINWIASQWKAPWKCLVTHDGVFDQRNMGYATEELWFTEWENGGRVYDVPQNYDRFNPALHVNEWSVPMLVVHSDLDYRIPVEQGIGAFTALQSRGIESKFLRFPDENHWVLKPRNALLWHRTVFDWLKQHIGG